MHAGGSGGVAERFFHDGTLVCLPPPRHDPEAARLSVIRIPPRVENPLAATQHRMWITKPRRVSDRH